MNYVPDHYQKAVIDAAENGTGHVQVNAVAGSGKSSTIEAASVLSKGRGRIIAFNKSIATAMTQRLQEGGIRHVTASTIHSLAYGAVMREFGQVEINSSKTRAIATEIVGEGRENAAMRGLVTRLSSLCKLTLTDPTQASIDQLVDHYDLDVADVNGQYDEIYSFVPAALEMAKEQTQVIDFDDQVWFPVIFDLPIRRFDFVFVDECQDLNAVQRAIALKTQASQVITVGDERQAIYGFAGADVASMRKLREDLNAQELPLSICYRCPTSHLELARKIVPQIEARPDAPRGTVDHLSSDEALRRYRDGDLIICRANAPIASLCMELIRLGKKATIKGRDIGSSLLTLVDKRMVGTDLLTGLQQLYKWRDREVLKLEKQGKDAKIASLNDRVETIAALSTEAQSVAVLRSRILGIFQDNPKDGIILSSIHRAKGLEADKVVIYKPSMMPSSFATPGTWQYEQEMNLLYVALTRSKKTLWMVEES